jgi:hypothetical protein
VTLWWRNKRASTRDALCNSVEADSGGVLVLFRALAFFSSRFSVSFGVVSGFSAGILHLAPGILHFALDLLGRAFGLALFIARPLAGLALDAAG